MMRCSVHRLVLKTAAAARFASGGAAIVHRSPRKSVLEALGETGDSFTDYFREKCERNADETAFVCGVSAAELKYSDVVSMTEFWKRELYHRHGIRHGDVVAVLSPNSIEYAAIFHGVLQIGGTVTTMNPTMTPHEIAKQLQLSHAKTVVTVPLMQPHAEQAAGILAAASPDRPPVTVTTVSALTPNPTEASHAVPSSALRKWTGDDVIVLPFSSGTTGMPKGVQLTNRNLMANVLQCQEIIHFTPDDVMMAILPYFHIYGMIVVMHGVLNVGAAQVVMPKFDMDTYLALISKHKATCLFVAPPVLIGLVKSAKVKQMDMSSIKLIFSGAAPLGDDLHAKGISTFPGASISQGYGLTETSPVLAAQPREHAPVSGSCGKLVADTEARIVKTSLSDDWDEDVHLAEDCATDEEGELWVRGPQVMKGYLRDEDTRKVFTRNGKWFRTGDIAKFDAAGNLFITDRVKELIKYKGYQVAPAELEALLHTHDLIQDVVVIGIPVSSHDGTELPTAHVVLMPTVTEEERKGIEHAIQEFVAKRVSPHKQLRGGVRIVESIPKNASGKLLRRVAKETELELLKANPHPHHQ